MVCVMPPTADDSVLTVSIAVDVPEPEALRVLVPRVVLVVVSMKVTLPAGDSVLGALAVIVAVNVTGSPKTVGLLEVLSEAEVVPWLTVSVGVPLEPLKSTLAVNVPVTVSVPTGKPLEARK